MNDSWGRNICYWKITFLLKFDIFSQFGYKEYPAVSASLELGSTFGRFDVYSSVVITLFNPQFLGMVFYLQNVIIKITQVVRKSPLRENY